MKKLQNSLYITRDGAYLHKERETLLVEQTVEGQRKKLLQIPIHSVGNIFCFGNVLVSPQLMGFCGENGTQLAFYDAFGRFQARVVGKQTGNVLLRRAQFRRADCVDSRENHIARNIVVAKVHSSRVVLQRHLRTYGSNPDVSAAAHRLRQIVAELKSQSDPERILGFEGEAARHYFGVFSQLINSQTGFVFDGRTRRPPRIPSMPCCHLCIPCFRKRSVARCRAWVWIHKWGSCTKNGREGIAWRWTCWRSFGRR